MGFPVALSGGRLLFPSICEEVADGAVWGRALFSLAFVAFGTFGTGNPLLWYARVVVCEYVIGYFRRTDNSLKLSATLSGDGIV